MSTSAAGGQPNYLFSTAQVNSPLEELREVYQRKLRALGSREGKETAERIERALEIAESALARALSGDDQSGRGRQAEERPESEG